jgi:GDPmannose 4,6-dehydratase
VPKALITGIGGQTGSYMADLLLEKGYEVHGIIRRSSNFNTQRIEPIDRFSLYQGDITDSARMSELINKIKPDEIYHFAAQSHVKSGFDQPLYTQDSIVDGTLVLLEGIRNFSPASKLYYAGSSEMFGNSYPDFKPISPYGCAKLYGYHLCELYKQAYGLFIVAGILFNHESPRRGITFVSRKITHGLAQIKAGKADHLALGNLDASRDWGYAPEFVEAIYLLMHQEFVSSNPDPNKIRNCEIGTGETHTIREFVEEALRLTGLGWECIELSDKYKRPFELNLLKADPAKYEWLGWKPKTKFKELVRIMVEADLRGVGIHGETAIPPVVGRTTQDQLQTQGDQQGLQEARTRST